MTWIMRLCGALRGTFASAAVLAIAAFTTAQAAQQFWEKTPFTEWTQAEAMMVLSSYPWVRQISIFVPAGYAAPVDAGKIRARAEGEPHAHVLQRAGELIAGLEADLWQSEVDRLGMGGGLFVGPVIHLTLAAG